MRIAPLRSRDARGLVLVTDDPADDTVLALLTAIKDSNSIPNLDIHFLSCILSKDRPEAMQNHAAVYSKSILCDLAVEMLLPDPPYKAVCRRL